MNKLLVVLVGLFLVGASYGADAPSVVERTDCSALKAKIDALTDPDTDEAAELNATYRRDCSARAAARRGTARAATNDSSSAIVVETVAIGTQATIDSFLARRSENCKSLDDAIAKISSNAEMADDARRLTNLRTVACGDISDFDAVASDVAAANLAAGLCADGSAHNKFGCCAGETFKDLGGGNFGCCPKSGGECYTPAK